MARAQGFVEERFCDWTRPVIDRFQFIATALARIGNTRAGRALLCALRPGLAQPVARRLARAGRADARARPGEACLALRRVPAREAGLARRSSLGLALALAPARRADEGWRPVLDQDGVAVVERDVPGRAAAAVPRRGRDRRRPVRDPGGRGRRARADRVDVAVPGEPRAARRTGRRRCSSTSASTRAGPRPIATWCSRARPACSSPSGASRSASARPPTPRRRPSTGWCACRCSTASSRSARSRPAARGSATPLDADPGGMLPTSFVRAVVRESPFDTLVGLRRRVGETRGRYAEFVARLARAGDCA